MLKDIRVTKRSKVGWEYNTSSRTIVLPSGYTNWTIDKPEKPYYTGTIRQVINARDNDRTFALVKSGGTYYSTAWFVKYKGKWHRISETSERNCLADLIGYMNEKEVFLNLE